MGERALGICLILVSILIPVGALAAAFAANGWDLQKTIVPEISRFEDMMPSDMEDIMTIDEPENIMSVEHVTARFNSPFDFPVTFETFSGEIYCTEHDFKLATIGLESPVVAQPSVTTTLTLKITRTPGCEAHILTQHGGSQPDMGGKNLNLKLDIYGIKIEFTQESFGG
jgi:hypothetical protein